MSPLAANVQRLHQAHDPNLAAAPVKASTAIFTGGLVCIEAATKGAVPGADATGVTFFGVAHRGFDNSDGLIGSIDGNDSVRFCVVDREGVYAFTISGTAPAAGDPACIVDDDTVALAGGTTHAVICGQFVRPAEEDGKWYVDIEKVAVP